MESFSDPYPLGMEGTQLCACAHFTPRLCIGGVRGEGRVMSVGGLSAWMSVFEEEVVHGLLKLVSRCVLY